MKKLLILGIFCMLAALALPALASQPEAPADGIKMNKGGKKEVVFNHNTRRKVNEKANFCVCIDFCNAAVAFLGVCADGEVDCDPDGLVG